MEFAHLLALLLFVSVCACLMAGFPVSFTLGGTAILFAELSYLLEVLAAFPQLTVWLPKLVYGSVAQ